MAVCAAFDYPEKCGVAQMEVISLSILVESPFMLDFSGRSGTWPCVLFLVFLGKLPDLS